MSTLHRNKGKLDANINKSYVTPKLICIRAWMRLASLDAIKLFCSQLESIAYNVSFYRSVIKKGGHHTIIQLLSKYACPVAITKELISSGKASVLLLMTQLCVGQKAYHVFILDLITIVFWNHSYQKVLEPLGFKAVCMEDNELAIKPRKVPVNMISLFFLHRVVSEATPLVACSSCGYGFCYNIILSVHEESISNLASTV